MLFNRCKYCPNKENQTKRTSAENLIQKFVINRPPIGKDFLKTKKLEER